ncbi:MAG: hypothetical protein ABWY17_21930 [Pseudomonas sp.]
MQQLWHELETFLKTNNPEQLDDLNTNAAAMMIGDKAAAMIQED